MIKNTELLIKLVFDEVVKYQEDLAIYAVTREGYPSITGCSGTN